MKHTCVALLLVLCVASARAGDGPVVGPFPLEPGPLTEILDRVEAIEAAGHLTLGKQALAVGLGPALVAEGTEVRLQAVVRPTIVVGPDRKPAIKLALHAVDLSFSPPALVGGMKLDRLVLGQGAALPPLESAVADELVGRVLADAAAGRPSLDGRLRRAALERLALRLKAGATWSSVGASASADVRLGPGSLIELFDVVLDGAGLVGALKAKLSLVGAAEDEAVRWALGERAVEATSSELTLRGDVAATTTGWAIGANADAGELELSGLRVALGERARVEVERLALAVKSWSAVTVTGSESKVTTTTTLSFRPAVAEGLTLALRGGELEGDLVAPDLAVTISNGIVTAGLGEGATLRCATVRAQTGAGELDLAEATIGLPPLVLGAAPLATASVMLQARRASLAVRGGDRVVVASDARIDVASDERARLDLAAGRLALPSPLRLRGAARELVVERPGRRDLRLSELQVEVALGADGGVTLSGAGGIALPTVEGGAQVRLSRVDLMPDAAGKLRLTRVAGAVRVALGPAQAAIGDALLAELQRQQPDLFDELVLPPFRYTGARLATHALEVALGDAPGTLRVAARGAIATTRERLVMHVHRFRPRFVWEQATAKDLATLHVRGDVALAARTPGPLAGLSLGVRATASSIKVEPHITPLRGLRPTIPLRDVEVYRGEVVAVRPEAVARWPEALRDLVVRGASIRRDGDDALLELEASEE